MMTACPRHIHRKHLRRFTVDANTTRGNCSCRKVRIIKEAPVIKMQRKALGNQKAKCALTSISSKLNY